MIHLLDVRVKLDAACFPHQRMPLVVDVMCPVKRARRPNSVCTCWLEWITLNSVPYPVKDAFQLLLLEFAWSVTEAFLCQYWGQSFSCVQMCSGEEHLVALFPFCCTLNVLPLSVSEDVKETWLIVMTASIQALGPGCIRIAHGTNIPSLAGSSAEHTMA